MLIRALERAHPALARIEAHHPSDYLARRLDRLTPRAAELFALSPPVWVVKSRGAYLRIAGNRTYAVIRTVLGPHAIVPVCVLVSQHSPDELQEIAYFDVFGQPLLSSLDASGAQQLDDVAGHLFKGFRLDRPGRPPLSMRAVTTAGPGLVVGGPLTRARFADLLACDPSTLGRGRARRRRAR